jgi:hypothetical protein
MEQLLHSGSEGGVGCPPYSLYSGLGIAGDGLLGARVLRWKAKFVRAGVRRRQVNRIARTRSRGPSSYGNMKMLRTGPHESTDTVAKTITLKIQSGIQFVAVCKRALQTLDFPEFPLQSFLIGPLTGLVL